MKSIIETFNNVLFLIDEQEKELNQFIGEQDELDDSDEEEDSETASPEAPPKQGSKKQEESKVREPDAHHGRRRSASNLEALAKASQ